MSATESLPVTAGRRLYFQMGITLVVLAAAGAVLAVHGATLDSGTDRLDGADGEWVVLACAAAVATWMCAAVAQQGAVVERLPRGRLIAAQFAAAAANHVLPAGVGAGVVNLRFLRRCGLSAGARRAHWGSRPPWAGSFGPSGSSAAGRLPRPGPSVCTAPAFPVLCRGGRCRRPAVAIAAARGGPVLADVRAVHRSGARGRAVGRLAGLRLLHAAVVVAVVQALGLPVPPARVVVAYLAASSAAALLPTPGRIGSLDAALVVALTAAGAPGPAAARPSSATAC